jgi:hypothetical protein
MSKILLILLLLFVSFVSATLPSLNEYNVSLSTTTVSGLSAGAYMAVQLHVANSATIKGAGVVAGGPYHCAQGSVSTAVTRCMSGLPMPPNVASLEATTRQYSAAKRIDDVSELANARVYMFSGTFDTTVYQRVMDKLRDYYAAFLSDSDAQISYENTLKAAHTMPTDNPQATEKCSVSKSPFVANCHYDAVGVMLKHIYGASAMSKPRVAWGEPLGGTLLPFAQTEFTGGGADNMYSGLDQQGFVYVPASCAAQQPCKLHVALHGCLQNFESVGQDFMQLSGYLQWADTNELIVLFPQTIGTGKFGSNPNSCFDWWGFLDATQDREHYDDKQGLQMQAIWNMIDRIAQ